jgi:type VI secretion system protein ImpM
LKFITSVGFYGKLPIVGDFISRRLPDEFINSWDAWLQRSIACSQEELGEGWLNSYLTSPIWRFLLSPGVCGHHAVAGILMPSVDRVGRYFPLTVAVLIEPLPQLPLLFSTGSLWFEQLEDAALSGLEGNIDVDTFDQILQSISPFSLSPHITASSQPSEPKSFHLLMENIERIGDAFIELNTSLLSTFMPGYSLWSNAGSEDVEPALIVCQGLPSISSFSRFLKSDNQSDIKSKPIDNTENSLTSNDIPSLFEDSEEPQQISLSSILTGSNSSEMFPTWYSWAVTDTGKRRKHNEDSFLNKPETGLWVVADGMGGHKAGDVASQLIINLLNKLIPSKSLENYIKDIDNYLQNVNMQLRQLAAKDYNNHIVGSTVVAMACDSHQCGFLWAGDSRLYRFRDNQLQQLTRDHCEDSDDNQSGWSVKKSNVITRAVGAGDKLELEFEITEVIKGDVFLLSSDGLDKELSFNDIETLIKNTKLEDLANTLLNETLNRGARDNVTIIVATLM